MQLFQLAITLFLLQTSQLHEVQTYTFSAGYIFLDGSTIKKSKIDELRKEIIAEYAQGQTFKNLIDKYNMDGNPKADRFEFVEEDVVPEFFQAVKNHKVGEIFTVDVPDNKWYYVVLRNPDSN